MPVLTESQYRKSRTLCSLVCLFPCGACGGYIIFTIILPSICAESRNVCPRRPPVRTIRQIISNDMPPLNLKPYRQGVRAFILRQKSSTVVQAIML